jgi:2-methylcitrate dehydratase PrpD
MDDPLSGDLAAFVSSVSFEDIPESGRALIEDCIADTVGVTFAGHTEGAGAIAGDIATATAGGAGDATLLGSGVTLPPTEAAFANATAAHCLDFDDYTMAIPAHSSVTMVPPILALSEAGNVTGREAVAAYAAGFETQYVLGSALSPGHYRAGWHATSTMGTFGATAAAAVLLDLDEGTTRAALGAAASMPAGVRRNFGTMAKPMHAGVAARSGVTAALLAAEGFTSAPDAIEAEHGFLDLYSGPQGPDLAARPELGSPWAIAEEGVIIKKYACCGAAHTAVAAAEAVATETGLDPGRIDSVTVTGPERLPDILAFPDPTSREEAKFSLHYPVASALARGGAGRGAFAPDAVADPAVQAVRERTTFVPDPDLPYDSSLATVRVRTDDGTAHERTRETRPGSPADPLSPAELRRKFIACTASSLDEPAATRAFDTLATLRDVDDVGTVVSGLG